MNNQPLTCASRKRGEQHRLEFGDDVANSLTTINTDSMVAEPQCLTPHRTQLGKQLRRQGQIERFSNREYSPRTDGICNTITHIQKDTMIAEPRYFAGKEYAEVAPTLKSSAYVENNFVKIGDTYYRIRKLTPVETGRLMGLRDNEIQAMLDCGLSKCAMYKLHGNSIVVDVLYHIFRTLFIPDQVENQVEPDLFSYDNE